MNENPHKPCPFCGGEAALKVTLHGPPGAVMGFYIKCTKCGTRTKLMGKPLQAIMLWDSRPSELEKKGGVQ
jgi:Lar family restriction alleviation protein